MNDRWFIMPAVREENDKGMTVTRPKYDDVDGVHGFSGTRMEPSEVGQSYAGLIQQFPDVEEWYVVRFYTTDDTGMGPLNEIHNKQDSRTLADHANDVAPLMESHFGWDSSERDVGELFRVESNNDSA